MKKLGILGGMGPESTLLYYKEIASKFRKRDEKGVLARYKIYNGTTLFQKIIYRK